MFNRRILMHETMQILFEVSIYNRLYEIICTLIIFNRCHSDSHWVSGSDWVVSEWQQQLITVGVCVWIRGDLGRSSLNGLATRWI